MKNTTLRKRLAATLVASVLMLGIGTDLGQAASPQFPAELTGKVQKREQEREELKPKQVYQKMLKGTVWIHQFANQMAGHGTGWIVDADKGLVMTNHHVVDRGEDVIMFLPKFDQGKLVTDPEEYTKYTRPIKGKVIDSDRTRDLALIRIEGKLPSSAESLPMAKESASPADMLHVVGGLPSGSNGVFSYTNGYVREVSHGKGVNGGRDIWLIRHNIATNRGNSGGALVNSHGEVVGVHNMGMYDVAIKGTSGGIDLKEVKSFIKEVESLYPATTAKAAYEAGKRHYRAGRYDSAIDYFSSAIRKDSKHAEAYRMRGWSFTVKKDLDSAKRDFTSAIEHDSTNWNAFYGRGKVLGMQGNSKAAIADQNEAIRLNPKAKFAYLQRGDLYRANRQYENAVKDYSRAIETDKSYISAINQRGRTYLNLGLYTKALADFEEAYRLRPHPIYCNNVAVALERMGKKQEAVQLYQRATQMDPNYTLPRKNLALVYMEAKNYDAAVYHLNFAIQSDPKSSQFFYLRAKSFDALKQLKLALTDINMAIQLYKKDADYFAVRSAILSDLGYEADAVKDIRYAAKLNPKKYGSYSNAKHITAKPRVESPKKQKSQSVGGTWSFKQTVHGVRYDCLIAFNATHFEYHLTWVDAAGKPGQVRRKGTYEITDGGWQVVLRSSGGHATKTDIGFKDGLLVIQIPEMNQFFSFKRVK